MNKIVLVGRLVRDPELKFIEDIDRYCTHITLAVDRNFKDSEGNVKADFIPVTIWGKKAETLCKYTKKGSCISVSGRIRTGSYKDKEGNNKYIVEVIGDEFKFINTGLKEEITN